MSKKPFFGGKQQEEIQGLQTAMSEPQTQGVEIQTRQDKPAEKDGPFPLKLRAEGLENFIVCPYCQSHLLQDRRTRACQVTKTMPQATDEKGNYTDRYVLCRSIRCNGRTFVARERQQGV